MANSKTFKFEMQASDGHWVEVSESAVISDGFTWEVKTRVSFWRHPVQWLKNWIKERRFQKMYKPVNITIETAELTITGLYIPDPWKWN